MNETIKIFYVEDNEGDVELLTMCIERYDVEGNITLDIAETVTEAKEAFETNKYSIALIDWNLPDGEGIEVAEFIRQYQPNLPILLLSGALTSTHLHTAEKYNVSACIEKNYDKNFITQIYQHVGINT